MDSFLSTQNICSSKLFVTLWAAQRYSRLPVRTLSCLFNNPDFLKVLLHFEQLKGFSPVWILSCISNVADSLKVLSHIEQLKGFLCMWILSWIFKVPALANFLSHFEYLKGFSTVWILSCTFNIADSLKESLKYLPVWISYHTLNSKIVSVFPQNWCGHGSLCSILAVKQ